jgi:hypothetical protein
MLTTLRSYEIFEVLVLVRINKSMCLLVIFKFAQLRDTFPYQLVGGIPLKEGVQ